MAVDLAECCERSIWISVICMTRIPVLTIGDLRPGQLEATDLSWNGCEVTRVVDVPAAIRHLRESASSPAVVLIAQAWPGQVAARDVHRLRELAPLARIWVVGGTWSEGEARSGAPVLAALRSYWHQWPARWSHELSTDPLADCRLPVSASQEERLLHRSSLRLPRVDELVVIDAQSAETAAAMGDACRALGCAWVWRRGEVAMVEGASVVLWDATASQLEDEPLARRRVAEAQPAPVVAVTSFPRPETHRAAQRAGVAGLVSKPYLLEDLAYQIGRAMAAVPVVC